MSAFLIAIPRYNMWKCTLVIIIAPPEHMEHEKIMHLIRCVRLCEGGDNNTHSQLVTLYGETASLSVLHHAGRSLVSINQFFNSDMQIYAAISVTSEILHE